jgi:hypothetical protein
MRRKEKEQDITRIAGQAVAKVAVDSVLAGTTIGARVGQTFIDVDFTIASRISGTAEEAQTQRQKERVRSSSRMNTKTRNEPAAKVGLDSIVAGTSVLADVERAIVDVGLAARAWSNTKVSDKERSKKRSKRKSTRIARQAVAKIAVHTIEASTAIETRQSSTFVDVGLALRTCEKKQAELSHSKERKKRERSVTGKARQARAKIAIDSVLAYSAVGTRIGGAVVDIGLTIRARETRKAVQKIKCRRV